MGALIGSIKFLSLEVTLYLCKSTTRLRLKYCCYVWPGALSCYLDMVDSLEKWICRTVGPALTVSLEPFGRCTNLASLSIFYRHYFGRCLSELAELFPLHYSRRRSTRYSDRLHDFSISVLRFYKDVYIQQFLSSHSWTLEFSVCRMLSFDL